MSFLRGTLPGAVLHKAGLVCVGPIPTTTHYHGNNNNDDNNNNNNEPHLLAPAACH